MEEMKELTQEILDSMSPSAVLKIGEDSLPDGYDVSFEEGGFNPKLIKCEEENFKDPDQSSVEPEIVEEIEEVKEPSPYKSETPVIEPVKGGTVVEATMPDKPSVPYQYTEEDNRGVLFLRYFKRDESNGKVLTFFNRKVYFPSSKIEPGWYVACITEEHPRFGIMDAVEMDLITEKLWNRKYIKGIHTKVNVEKGVLEIYPAVHKEKLKKESPQLLHTVKLDASRYYNSGNTIRDIITQKEKEAQEGR